jgi:hypothetical protein
MSTVIISMESNEVTVQNAKQNLLSHREDSIDFATRERGVQKEANLHRLAFNLSIPLLQLQARQAVPAASLARASSDSHESKQDHQTEPWV